MRTALLAILVLLVPLPVSALPPSGLTAIQVNDEYSEAFLAFLKQGPRGFVEELGSEWRLEGRIADQRGAPVPFAEFRILSAGGLMALGRSLADGSFALALPQAPQDRIAWRVEVSAIGGAAVETLSSLPAGSLSLTVDPARPPPLPLPLELVFVLDATESMRAYLPACKRAILGALDAVEKAFDEAGEGGSIAIRPALVLYRDRGEAFLTKATSFSAARRDFEAALAQAEAAGGGDLPEDLGSALRLAVDGLDYSADSLRLVFAFTDAAPAVRAAGQAGEEAHYADACRTALGKGIRIIPVAMGRPSADGEFALRQIASYTRGAYIMAETSRDRGYRPVAIGDGAQGALRGELEALLARLVLSEARAALAGGGQARDPAVALLEAVEARMAAGLRYPEAARARGLEGKVRVELDVAADGRLRSARVLGGSGSSILDHAAIELSRSVFPLPNPAGTQVVLEIVVEYRLTAGP